MLRSLSLAAAVAAPLAAQMELRRTGRYDRDEFAQEAPAIAAPAPDLRLFDLSGRPRCLALERGRIVVLIGGAYT
ncbi:MAG TPA: hypothetical protein VFZ65_13305 [Planctomycetota bacterium]|nr:hypothetical protein [Planctomycetota bacterium]